MGELIKRKSFRFKALAVALMLVLLLAIAVSASLIRTTADEAARQAAEALASIEESRLKAAEAKTLAEDTKQIVDEAFERAEKARDEALLRQKESDVQAAVQMTALAMVAHSVETGAYTSNYDDLLQFGWQPNPDLIYGDLLVGQTLDGQPNFKVIIRHKDPEPRGFKYDQASGLGVEPAEASPTDRKATATSAPEPVTRRTNDRNKSPEMLGWGTPGHKFYDQERAVQIALHELALVQAAQQVEKDAFTTNYEDFIPYGWKRNPDLIYGDIKIFLAPDGKPGFEVVVRHKDPGPSVFRYSTIDGVQPVE